MKTETERHYEETTKLLTEAISLFNEGKYEEAKEKFKKLKVSGIPEFEEKAETYLEIISRFNIKERKVESEQGKIYEMVFAINEKEPERALEIAEQIKEDDPKIDYLRAIALTMLDRKEEAVQALKLAVSRDKKLYFVARKEPDLFPLWDTGLLEDLQ